MTGKKSTNKPPDGPVTGQPVVLCGRCGRPLTYEPGHVSEALTAHYETEHLDDLAGREQRRKLVVPRTRYGRLKVVKETEPVVGRDRKKSRAVLCLCDCGNEATVRLSNLPRTHSCGCLRREVSATLTQRRLAKAAEDGRSGQSAPDDKHAIAVDSES